MKEKLLKAFESAIVKYDGKGHNNVNYGINNTRLALMCKNLTDVYIDKVATPGKPISEENTIYIIGIVRENRHFEIPKKMYEELFNLYDEKTII